MGKITSFRDLDVYKELCRLHLAVHVLTQSFPRFELYELGAQLRRSSNAAPAIFAEGWGSRHTNVYLEAVNRSMGEIRETQHHLDMAKAKGYVSPDQHRSLDCAYNVCGRMLENLYRSLSRWVNSRRTASLVSEGKPEYQPCPTLPSWETVEEVTSEVSESVFPPEPRTQNPEPNSPNT